MSLFADFGNLEVKRFLEAFTRLTKMKKSTTTLLQNVYMHAFRLLDLGLYLQNRNNSNYVQLW